MSQDPQPLCGKFLKKRYITLFDGDTSFEVKLAPGYRNLLPYLLEMDCPKRFSAPAFGTFKAKLDTWSRQPGGPKFVTHTINGKEVVAVWVKGAGLGLWGPSSHSGEDTLMFRRKVFFVVMSSRDIFHTDDWYIVGFAGKERTENVIVTTKQYFVCSPDLKPMRDKYFSRVFVFSLLDLSSQEDRFRFSTVSVSFLDTCREEEKNPHHIPKTRRTRTEISSVDSDSSKHRSHHNYDNSPDVIPKLSGIKRRNKGCGDEGPVCKMARIYDSRDQTSLISPTTEASTEKGSRSLSGSSVGVNTGDMPSLDMGENVKYETVPVVDDVCLSDSHPLQQFNDGDFVQENQNNCLSPIGDAPQTSWDCQENQCPAFVYDDRGYGSLCDGVFSNPCQQSDFELADPLG